MKLLKILQNKGRASFKEMGEKVGLSTSGVKRRVEELRKMGVIKGFTVDLDEERLGYPVTALLEVHIRPDKAEGVARNLAQREEISEVNRMFQNPEIIAKVHAESVDRVDELKRDLARGRSVDDVEAKIVMRMLGEKARI